MALWLLTPKLGGAKQLVLQHGSDSPVLVAIPQSKTPPSQSKPSLKAHGTIASTVFPRCHKQQPEFGEVWNCVSDSDFFARASGATLEARFAL